MRRRTPPGLRDFIESEYNLRTKRMCAFRVPLVRTAMTNSYTLWNPEVHVPTRDELVRPDGAWDVLVHHANTDRYHFLHDTSVAMHNGVLHTAWYNCPDREIQDESLIRGRRSSDGGRTWSDVETIAKDETGEGLHYVPPQLFTSDGTLYSLIGIMVGPDFIRRTDLYRYDDESGKWRYVRKVADAFQQNTAPVQMSNGDHILPGRMAGEIDAKSLFSAVAISDRVDGDWHLVQLPTGDLCKPHPETTVYADADCITALVRDDHGPAQVFESRDFGRSWSGPFAQNLPIAASKMYAGKLSTGQRYLLCNINSDGNRELLTISVSHAGEPTLCRMWAIRNGFDLPHIGVGPQWSYPSAYEHEGTLYITYTSEKRHCMMTAIPVESLRAD